MTRDFWCCWVHQWTWPMNCQLTDGSCWSTVNRDLFLIQRDRSIDHSLWPNLCYVDPAVGQHLVGVSGWVWGGVANLNHGPTERAIGHPIVYENHGLHVKLLEIYIDICFGYMELPYFLLLKHKFSNEDLTRQNRGKELQPYYQNTNSILWRV